MQELVRLQKFLSECGIASRRHAEQLIAEGRVKVDGQVITEQGKKIRPGMDVVRVDDKIVKAEVKGVLLLYKPRSVVSTLSDPEGRPAISDYLSKHFKSYFPVGRLDWESSGLVILTNDGELAEYLLHPRYGFERVYHVRVFGFVKTPVIEKIEKGVMLDDGLAKAKVKYLEDDKKTTWLELRVTEGRNRLIRRIFDRVRHPVEKLVRMEHGPFKLGKLRPGQVRQLTEKEYQLVRKKVLQEKAGIKGATGKVSFRKMSWGDRKKVGAKKSPFGKKSLGKKTGTT